MKHYCVKGIMIIASIGISFASWNPLRPITDRYAPLLTATRISSESPHFHPFSQQSQVNILAPRPLYPQGKILAEYVDPRSRNFAGFPAGSCTEYIARQRPHLFINADGSRHLRGNAQDWLLNAQKLGIPTGKTPQKGAIAVYREGHGGRAFGHVAYVEDIQSDGTLIISEMNYEYPYTITYRVVSAKTAAGYIY